MKRRHTRPSYYARNAAMQAQRRFLRTGKTEAERLDDHREATANVLVLCILAAIYDKYGIGEMRLQRVVDCANEISAKYALEKQVRGEERAKATLVAAVWWFMPPFLLPALSAPKTEREAVQLAARREAADTVMKIYVQAMHKALGFGADRVAVVYQGRRVLRVRGAGAEDRADHSRHGGGGHQRSNGADFQQDAVLIYRQWRCWVCGAKR